jgi:hypothetical protein
MGTVYELQKLRGWRQFDRSHCSTVRSGSASATLALPDAAGAAALRSKPQGSEAAPSRQGWERADRVPIYVASRSTLRVGHAARSVENLKRDEIAALVIVENQRTIGRRPS